jgi:hypothetical protein
MTKENIKKKKLNKKPAITTYLMPFAIFKIQSYLGTVFKPGPGLERRR